MSQGVAQGTIDAGAPSAHSGKTTTIIINATPYEFEGKEISFEQLVALFYAGAPPTGPNIVITIHVSRGENGEEGSMLPGGTVKVKNKMVFDVDVTDRS